MTPLVLVTGGTGYVGGRLIDALRQRNVRIRALARRPDALAARVAPDVEAVPGDVLDPATLAPALAGVHTAYYLVHSMGARGDFAALDRQAAEGFAAAARRAGVARIVYLGGLGDAGADLSPHLRSRHDTGDALRTAGVPVLEFRASIIIGSGSLSFEMIRALVDRLPVMICPRWVSIAAQPIAIDDVTAYLVGAMDRPAGESRTFEIGGPDVVSYGDIMREYARQRGLRRVLLPVPLLTPRLSSLWLGLVTPLYARVGRKLISGVRNATVVRDRTARHVFDIEPHSLRSAIARALGVTDSPVDANRWSDARSAGTSVATGQPRPSRVFVDSREVTVATGPASAFAPIRRIGGEQGWYYANPLWRLRGALDLLAGGVGMRRGRRDPESCRVGDALDFWRVRQYEADRRLVLEAEMRLPGRATLAFDVEETAQGHSRLRQTARFEPDGMWGRLYWYALWPAHALIFAGMLRGIAARGRAGLSPAGMPHVASPDAT